MVAIKIDGYERVSITKEDGKKVYTRDKGDNVAVALRGKTLDEIGAIMAENGMAEDFTSLGAERDDGAGGVKTLNNGQVRMLCGQKLRSLLKRQGKIIVEGEEVENDIPVKEKAPKAAAEVKVTEVTELDEEDEEENDDGDEGDDENS